MQAKINVWMNRKGKRFYLLVTGCCGVLLGLTLITAGVSQSVAPATALYGDRTVFQTEEEYGAFKTLLTDGNITIREFREVSSLYPVLVAYEIKAPLSLNFPYSEPTQTWGKDVSVAKNRMLLGLGALGIIAGIFLTLRFFNKLG